MRTTKWYIMLYIMAFIGVLPLFAVFGYVSPLYLLIMVPLGLAWLWRGVQGFDTQDDGRWARKMFLFSLIVLMSLSVSISLGCVACLNLIYFCYGITDSHHYRVF